MLAYRLGGWLLAAVLIVSASIFGLTASSARAQGRTELMAPGEVTTGKLQFRRYCASCHGEDAKGEGPVAAALTKKPPDLTALSQKNNGTFPEKRVVEIIDGTSVIEAHGTRAMPVWGVAFGKARPKSPTSPPLSEREVREKVNLIVDYLKSIQVK